MKIIMSSIGNYAKKELEILFQRSPDSVLVDFKDDIINLCDKFGNSGQSGGSAPYVAAALSSVIKKLCLFQPINPVTGDDSEWVEVSEWMGKKMWQNNRCGAIFKQEDGVCTYSEAVIWRGQYDWDKGTNEWNDTYTGRAFNKETGETLYSSMKIKSFPFIPTRFYIDVVREILPEDWNEEPFIEHDYKDSNGKIIKEKYRNVVKDPKQLEEVFKYYDVK